MIHMWLMCGSCVWLYICTVHVIYAYMMYVQSILNTCVYYVFIHVHIYIYMYVVLCLSPHLHISISPCLHHPTAPQLHIHFCSWICTCIPTGACEYVYVYVNIYIYIYIYRCRYIGPCICVYICNVCFAMCFIAPWDPPQNPMPCTTAPMSLILIRSPM